jgi:hypothetical protein
MNSKLINDCKNNFKRVRYLQRKENLFSEKTEMVNKSRSNLNYTLKIKLMLIEKGIKYLTKPL